MNWSVPAMALVLTAVAGLAAAADNPFTNAGPGSAVPAPQAAPADGTTRVVLSRETCARLVRHRPSADAAYRPGVDARGRPVTPADGGDGLRVDVPDQIAFDVAINPLRGGAARFGETQMSVGRVEYDMASGVARLNGQPLTDPETQDLSQRCQKVLSAGRR
ncbi:MAG: hypothetical protein AB7G39_19560 [Alphaproteobacteria bacterium]